LRATSGATLLRVAANLALAGSLTLAAKAQVVLGTPRGVVLAREGVVEAWDQTARTRLWQTEGLAHPTFATAGEKRVAVVSALTNEVMLLDPEGGRGTLVQTAETPVDGAFIGTRLFLLARDARRLERISAGGERASVALAADPAFLRTAGGRIFVYGRLEGVIQDIDPERMTVIRELRATPFASDFETDGRQFYLVDPREAVIRIWNVADSGARAGEASKPKATLKAGAVPVDLAFGARGTALTARMLAVADPGAKRVWFVEGTQSFGQAFGRGFLRGLLGFGLFATRGSELPSGVDRVVTREELCVGYDSSSGTLYRITKSKSMPLAAGVPPRGFALTADGVVFWRNGMLVAKKLR
jgi:hypothetical protein